MAIEKLKTKFASGAWINNVKSYFTKINEIIDYINGNNGLGNKTYKVLISQTGTDAPTVDATHINDSGLTFTFARTGIGTYTLTPSVPQTDTKCWWSIQSIDTLFVAWIGAGGVLTIQTYDDAYVLDDGLLDKTPLLYEIYP